MIKVLNIVGGMNYGGIEILLKNYCEYIDSNEFVYDFLTTDQDNTDTIKKIREYGGNVFFLTRRRTNPLKHLKELYVFLKKNKSYYDIIHVHMNYEAYIPLFIAKILNYKIRIAHSHTSFINMKVSKSIKVKSQLTTFFSNYHLGCSKTACDFLFGKKESYVVNNCICYDKYYFNDEKRKSKRVELELKDNEIALVQIGRFNFEKNHIFSCDLMKNIKTENIKLFFVGQGENFDEIKFYVAQNNIDNICFLGARSDISDLLNAFDAMIMPSLHEGFPMVLIEAQVNGLKCFVSEGIPKNVDISKKVNFLPLNLSRWIEAIKEEECIEYNRLYSGDDTYDVNKSLECLLSIYKDAINSVIS